ncbi:hypothetical protein SAMD00023353_0105340 [Rosellinia necatrix]|uniref:Uncharacterized protein n=1 Tax=Rosellinia necatrix TaxID=77044 RepID=A0A1S7UID1_ROSNE|nr:hypothetical protein SAMD00023353_0105340 [Rosellinia necatrix]
MKVYEESAQDRPGLYAVDAPSPKDLLKNLVSANNQIHRILPYVSEAVYTLDTMLLDLYQHLRRLDKAVDENQPGAIAQRFSAQQDARDLLTFIRYVLDGPIRAVLMGLDKKIKEEDNKNTDDQYLKKVVDGQLELVVNAMLQSIFKLQDPQPFFESLSTLSKGWKAEQDKATVANVPMLGPMELLLRIVARNCDNIEDFRETAKKLRVCHGSDERLLIPACVFACPGPDPAPPTGRLCVVTTSAERWWWYPIMNSWVVKTRNKRSTLPPMSNEMGNFDAAAASALLRPAMEAAGVWDYAGKNYTEGERLDRRREFIEIWRQDPAKRAIHVQEPVLDVGFPDFRDKARCVRCMHLFAYNVSDECLGFEEEQIKPERISGSSLFVGWSCAETIAHYYCVDAKHV